MALSNNFEKKILINYLYLLIRKYNGMWIFWEIQKWAIVVPTQKKSSCWKCQILTLYSSDFPFRKSARGISFSYEVLPSILSRFWCLTKQVLSREKNPLICYKCVQPVNTCGVPNILVISCIRVNPWRWVSILGGLMRK